MAGSGASGGRHGRRGHEGRGRVVHAGAGPLGCRRTARGLLESSADIIVVLDGDGLVRFANPAGQDLLGHPAGSLLGADAFALVHDDDQPTAQDAFAAVLTTPGRVGPVELRLRTVGGQWRHVELVGRNLLDDAAVTGVILNIRDVTDRVSAQEAMRASDRRYRHIADNAPDLIFRYRLVENPASSTSTRRSSRSPATPPPTSTPSR